MLDRLSTTTVGQHSLYEQIIDPANLLSAWKRVRRNKGAHGGDGVSWQRFEARLEKELSRLHDELYAGRYRPGRVSIARPDGKSAGSPSRPFAIALCKLRQCSHLARRSID